MIIKDKNGNNLFQTRHKTMKATLEYCIQNGMTLKGANIRNHNLKYANLDGLNAPDATFWRCDFTGSDIGYAQLCNIDFRACDFTDTCFANSDLTHADMRGAYFSKTLFDDAIMDGAILSCPSFWQCNISSIKSIKGLTYVHKGEWPIKISNKPVIINRNGHGFVMFDDYCLWNNGLYPSGLLPLMAVKELFGTKILIEKLLGGCQLQNAKNTMPKIHIEK